LTLVPTIALAADSDADCRIYQESATARQPLDGKLKRTFVNESHQGDSPGEYAKIFFCARADDSLYIVVRDGFLGVTNPPQDVTRYYESNYWDHYEIKTQLESNKLELVAYGTHTHLNGNPDHLWVFATNPDKLGGMPLVEADLVDHLAPNR
jgi:hypothetical protein